MSNRDIVNRELVNDFLVKLFNQIIDIEQLYMVKNGIVGLSVSELHLLDTISTFTNPTMSEIAQKATLTNGTITTAVKKLESKGCLERKKDPNDRRIIRVIITNKGHQAISVHNEFHDDMVARICDEQTLVENDVFIKALRQLTYFFEETKEALNDK